MWRIAIALLLVAPWQASADDPPSPPKPQSVEAKQNTRLPPALQRAIKKLSPNARLLQPSEVDAESCNPVPKTPGLVMADFNGDGLEDAAVLLKMRVDTELLHFDDKDYRRADMLLAIFLNDGKGGYRVRRASEFENNIPWAYTFIDIQKPGTVRGLGGQRTLKDPGVMLAICEKSAALFYLQGTKVRELQLSD